MSMGYTAEYVKSKTADQIADEMTALSSRRIAADNRSRVLRNALVAAESTLALMERPAHEDPDLASQVQAIGGGFSYGAIMSSAEALWRQLLEKDGLSGGEHVHGPARDTVDRALKTVREALA